jgi:Zn-dependent protease with chaperone function
MEGAGRLWRSAARQEILNGATKGTAQALPRVHAAAGKCAQALHIAVPAVYVVDRLPSGRVQTLGTNEDAAIVLERALVDELNDAELVDVIGRECGRIQNNHVVFSTAHYYVTNFANRFLKWIVTPARMALSGWSRRADVTADRAGLLCSRALDVSEAALAKVAPPDRLEKRLEALRLFAESAYFRGVTGQEGGASATETDAKVSV